MTTKKAPLQEMEIQEGLWYPAAWPGAKKRQSPGVYMRIGSVVYLSATIRLKKGRRQ